MDLYNGEIVAYETSKRPVFNLVSAMLQKVFRHISPEQNPMLHSDQGWQYQQPVYRRMMDQHRITQSMSRTANCLDNSALESFFGTLTAEVLHLSRFDSIEQLQPGIRQYIQ